MINEQVDLYKYFNLDRPNGAKGYLYCYDHYVSKEYCEKRLRPAILVIGGGGYTYVSDREKEPIAFAYLEKGYNAYTLEYSCAPSFMYPTQLLEGVMAMVYLRENSDELGIRKDKIAAIGFSAGGHLAGMLATIWNEKEIVDIIGKRVELGRPDAVVLAYPVIAYKYRHQGTIDSITGKDSSLLDKLSLEKRVTKNSSPAFIWCTQNDNVVPSENSLSLASEYKKNNVQFELHMFRSGVHGMSLATKETDFENYKPEFEKWYNSHVAKWFELSVDFLEELGFSII